MPELPQRKQIRIKDFDYSQNGYYFVTICTHNKQKILSEIIDGKTILNDLGKIVDFVWNDLKNHNDIKLHQYIIMPNHIHGIIEICRERFQTVPDNQNYHFGIPEIIRQFKTFSSKRINEHLKRNGLEPFPTGKLWQKSYYEHIIRDEDDYINATQYIIDNPLKWDIKEKYGITF